MTAVARANAPPYSAFVATIRSPDPTCAVHNVWIAAMPLANDIAASVRSSDATRPSNASSVGFP